MKPLRSIYYQIAGNDIPFYYGEVIDVLFRSHSLREASQVLEEKGLQKEQVDEICRLLERSVDQVLFYPNGGSLAAYRISKSLDSRLGVVVNGVLLNDELVEKVRDVFSDMLWTKIEPNKPLILKDAVNPAIPVMGSSVPWPSK